VAGQPRIDKEPVMHDTTAKVTAQHLARDAYLYVRQSSLHQVVRNTESARRQYDLRGRGPSRAGRTTPVSRSRRELR
jgi:hypothetical protein